MLLWSMLFGYSKMLWRNLTLNDDTCQFPSLHYSHQNLTVICISPNHFSPFLLSIITFLGREITFFSHIHHPTNRRYPYMFMLAGLLPAHKSSCSKCYAVYCFGTDFTHVQTCDVTRVQSATQFTASVHTSHLSKPVMQLVFKVLRNLLLRCILHTCPNLWCNRVQSAAQFTASVQTYRLYTCPNLWCNCQGNKTESGASKPGGFSSHGFWPQNTVRVVNHTEKRKNLWSQFHVHNERFAIAK